MKCLFAPLQVKFELGPGAADEGEGPAGGRAARGGREALQTAAPEQQHHQETQGQREGQRRHPQVTEVSNNALFQGRVLY